MSTHDPLTHGTAVTILPGVPMKNVPEQRTEATPAPQAQAPATPEAPAMLVAPPAAPPTAVYSPPAVIPVPPTAAYPPPAAPLPPAGPAYVPQTHAFPDAPMFAADVPAAAAPAAYPMDVPAAPATYQLDVPAAPAAYPMDVPVAAPAQASPFTPAPSPAFPPSDAVTAFPVQYGQIAGAPFQPQVQPIPVPLDIVPEEKQGKTGRRRKEGSGGLSVSPVKAIAIGAAVIGLTAGWFGHGALSGSNNTSTPPPVVTHAATSRVVPLASVAAVGSVHVLPKPWVTTGQQALLSSSVVSSSTPTYFGSGGIHGTFAEMGVSVGTLSRVAAARGDSFPAGPGGGTVRCGVNAIAGQATSWCTWKDAKSSGMVTRFATPTVTDAYRWTQLVRQTIEP